MPPPKFQRGAYNSLVAPRTNNFDSTGNKTINSFGPSREITQGTRVGWFQKHEIVANDSVQSPCGTLTSYIRKESIGDKKSKFLLAVQTFCTDTYNKDIGSKNHPTIYTTGYPNP
jgi:hypothetical protein